MEAIHIIGAGGIGCVMAHTLARAGHPIVLVEACPRRLDHARRHGVRVGRLPAVPLPVFAFTDWQPPRQGIVLLCVKTYHNPAVLARLADGVALVPIQNGFDPALAARPPHVEGVASFVSDCLPGTTHARITRSGQLHLGVAGRPDSGEKERLGRVQRVLAGGLRHAPFRLVRVRDVLPCKYTKLMYNAAISPLAAAAGLDNGELLRWPALRRLFFAMLRENHAILSRAGIPLGKVGPLHPATVAQILARPWLASALAWCFYPSLRGTYCSMAADLPHGPTEVDAYNGRLVALAGESPAPLNRAVLALIHGMVRGRIRPSSANLEPLMTLIEATPEYQSADPVRKRVAG